MTPAELASMLERAREDDAYRQVVHEGYLARLGSTIDLLRSEGLLRAKAPVGGPSGEWVMVEVEFSPPAADSTAGDSAAALEAAAESEKCACGHDKVAEHSGGLCIAGACDPALCNPTKAATP